MNHTTYNQLAARNDELEAEKADMAATLDRLQNLATHEFESKEDFIGRVRAVLNDTTYIINGYSRRQRDARRAADLLDKLLGLYLKNDGVQLSDIVINARDQLRHLEEETSRH